MPTPLLPVWRRRRTRNWREPPKPAFLRNGKATLTRPAIRRRPIRNLPARRRPASPRNASRTPPADKTRPICRLRKLFPSRRAWARRRAGGDEDFAIFVALVVNGADDDAHRHADIDKHRL